MVSVGTYHTKQLAKHSGLVAELMAEFMWKQRGIFRTWNEVPVISSFVYNKVCPEFISFDFHFLLAVLSGNHARWVLTVPA
jgi:hypothetical protein